ncbi:GGDEF domain-containing protein [Sulfurimonas sp.]|uniref:GGDEF domain-containing protein n=1 Tax=Sulfurimonas sp. TaxID=2022749 RepID=UPI003567D99C
MELLPISSDKRVQREQVRLLYAQGSIIQILGVVSSFIILAILWNAIEHSMLFIWLCVNVSIYLVRLFYVKKFSKIYKTNFDINKWKNIYIVSTFISGVSWGTLALFLDSSWSASHQLALFILYVGITAGAFNTNSSVFVSYLAFYIPPILMLLYSTIKQSSGLPYELVFLIIIYMILMYMTSLKFHNHLVNLLELRFQNEELATDLKLANNKLSHLADIDELSQIHNRRSMNKFLLQEWNWHHEEKKPLSLLMIDIDFFKQYNDTYGHSEGDRCILEIAKILKKNIRSDIDLASRYGGEEFVVILRDTDELEALNIAQRISLNVLSKQIEHACSEVSDYLTVSIGLSTMIPNILDEEVRIFDLADSRLYKAKENGRNQIVYS